MAKWTPCWQWVFCSQCTAVYICTPEHDYYNSSNNSDGVCGTCLSRGFRETLVSDHLPDSIIQQPISDGL